jgi:Protein of unknown function (DUF3037)
MIQGVGMATAYYSLIQFYPDLGRQEAFNIGLVVFCPNPHFFQVRLIDGFGAHSRGTSGFDPALFEAAKHDFRRRLIEAGRSFRQITDLASFRASGTNPIRLTASREMVLRDTASDVDAIFASLVAADPVKPHLAATRGPSMVTRLKNAFESRGLADLLDDDVDVLVPAFGVRRTIPFAYQNGRYNLIEPVDFALRNAATRQERASWFAVGGKSIFDVPDPTRGNRQLIVVARLPEERSEAKSVESVLSDYSVVCVPFSDQGLDQLAGEIRSHAEAH